MPPPLNPALGPPIYRVETLRCLLVPVQRRFNFEIVFDPSAAIRHWKGLLFTHYCRPGVDRQPHQLDIGATVRAMVASLGAVAPTSWERTTERGMK